MDVTSSPPVRITPPASGTSRRGDSCWPIGSTGTRSLLWRCDRTARPSPLPVATAMRLQASTTCIRIWDPRTGADLGQLRGHEPGDSPRWRSTPTASGWHRPARTARSGSGTPARASSFTSSSICRSGSTRSPSPPTVIGSPRPVKTARSTSGTWPPGGCCTCCAATPSASWPSPSIPITCIWPRRASMGRCGSGNPSSPRPRSGSSTVPAAGGSPGAPTAGMSRCRARAARSRSGSTARVAAS